MVQLYGADDGSLIETVCRYFADGLASGEGVLSIATDSHTRAFQRRLHEMGIDPTAIQQQGRAVFADATACLSMILKDGRPDVARFQQVIDGISTPLLNGGARRTLRAYGEMVGILWNAGKHDAAISLEDLWNQLLAREDHQLLCGYPIDVFSREFASAARILATHGRLLPSDPTGGLDRAFRRALREKLGNKIENLRAWMRVGSRPDWASMPSAEAEILWLQTNLPGLAPRVLDRARRYFRGASDVGPAQSRAIPASKSTAD